MNDINNINLLLFNQYLKKKYLPITNLQLQQSKLNSAAFQKL